MLLLFISLSSHLICFVCSFSVKSVFMQGKLHVCSMHARDCHVLLRGLWESYCLGTCEGMVYSAVIWQKTLYHIFSKMKFLYHRDKKDALYLSRYMTKLNKL